MKHSKESLKAFDSSKEFKGSHCEKIMFWFEKFPGTILNKNDLSSLTSLTDVQICRRLSELQNDGKIKEAGTKDDMTGYRLRLEIEPPDIIEPKKSKSQAEIKSLKCQIERLQILLERSEKLSNDRQVIIERYEFMHQNM